jgi:transposase
MEVIYPCCGGIDVHDEFVVVCLSRVQQGQRHKELRRFATYRADLRVLCEWLAAEGWTHVAMESTGISWRPLYKRLGGRFEVMVVNAHHMKAVPGRKTEVQDAEWIADLLHHGLLTASFVPPVEQQQLRDLTRLRISLVQERARLVNRVHKLLQDANIKVGNVLSDVLGVSGQAIFQALAQGETDPKRLANRAHVSVQRKHEQLVRALDGDMGEYEQFLLH